VAQADLHAESGAHIQSGDLQLRVEDFHLAVALDIAGCHHAGAHSLDKDGLGALAVQLGQQLLHIQNDLCHVLFHTGNGGKLVLHTGDLDAGGCRAGQRRKHNTAQCIAQRRSVAALQGFDHIFAIGSITRCFNTFNLGLLNFDHAVPSFKFMWRYGNTRTFVVASL